MYQIAYDNHCSLVFPHLCASLLNYIDLVSGGGDLTNLDQVIFIILAFFLHWIIQ